MTRQWPPYEMMESALIDKAQARAAEFDDEVDGELAALGDGDRGALGEHALDARRHVVEERDEHVALVAEVLIDGAARDAGLGADVGDVGVAVAARGEHALGGGEELGAARVGRQVLATAN